MTAWPWPGYWRMARLTPRASHMMPRSSRFSHRTTSWAYVLVCAPLALLLVELIRGTLHDTQLTRVQTLRTEIQEMRSQAMQQARGLEVLLEAHRADQETWPELREQPWLSGYWSGIHLAPHQLYVAVVNEAGEIVAHTQHDKIGDQLARGWYERRVGEAGPNVVWAQSSALSGDQPTYDVTAPLTVNGHLIGEFHAGQDARWLDAESTGNQRLVLARWIVVLIIMGTVDIAAIGGLIYLDRQQRRLWHRLRGESRERAREMAQVGSGLAHEIRNPLHALRINLHTLKRAMGGHSTLPHDQLVATIQESNSAIDRLDGLMRELLQFSDRSAGNMAEVDVVREVRATLNLLADNLRREQIDVHTELPETPMPVSVDPVRLRQVLLNLLIFAEHRAGASGRIEIAISPGDGGVEVAIGDSGALLPEGQRKHLFEPFQAPAETGSALGLALVQVYVDEVGGRISWDSGAAGENTCRLWLPLQPCESKGGRE